jgi:hypothetical protein
MFKNAIVFIDALGKLLNLPCRFDFLALRIPNKVACFSGLKAGDLTTLAPFD